MMDISLLTDLIAIARDTYKREYDEIKAQFERETADIRENFLGKTLNAQLERAQNKRDAAISALKNKTREQLQPQFQELRDAEFSRMQTIDSDILTKLHAVSNMQLSQAELNALANSYGHKNYYTDRVLMSIAAENGLNLPFPAATADTRLDVLSQLENQLETLLEHYDGTINKETLVLCNDSLLARAERQFNGNREETGEATEDAKRILTNIATKDATDFEKGLLLKNELQDASANVREQMLSILSANGVKMSSATTTAAGIKDEIAVRRQHGAGEQKAAANEIMGSLTVEDTDFQTITAKLTENRENPFLVTAVRESGNETLLKAARASDIATKTSSYNITKEIFANAAKRAAEQAETE